MRSPSINKLLQVFPDRAKAKEAKRILGMDNTGHRLKKYASVEAHRRACYNPPDCSYIKLLALNELAEAHGVEYFKSVKGEYAEYINMGESYAATILLWRGHFRVTSFGDFVEQSKEKFQ